MKTLRSHLNFIIIIFLLLLTSCGDSATITTEPQEILTGETATIEPEPDKNIPAEVPPTNEPEQTPVNDVEPAVDVGEYEDTPVGFTEDGFPYRGNPEASITIEEFSDYLCPFCSRHFRETLPTLIQEYVSQGQVQYVFRDLPLVSLHPNAPVGHKAAICAGRQNPVFYWVMHDELFSTQTQWGSAPDPEAFVTDLAKNSGVKMDAFEACMKSAEVDDQLEASVAAGNDLGFSGTPSFRFTHNPSGESYTLVGAYPIATFTAWLEALLAGEPPPQDQQAESDSPDLPYWATQNGLTPDPDRPGYTMAGDQFKGNPEAAVVIVEFSDFQCPACQQHALNVQPVLDDSFVKTGQVLWVFKHLPLQMHPQALVAAAAAECAADQNKFWEMHHLLFEDQEVWSVDNPESRLADLARVLSLDAGQFSNCLDSREPLERVFNDFYDGQGIIRSTPTFVILAEGKGTLVQGSREITQFLAIIQDAIDQVSETP